MNMTLLKDLQKMDMWMKVLLGVSVLVIVWALLWPRSSNYVKLVPVDIPGSNVNLYSAQVENMENQSQPTFAMFYAPWCGYCKKMMGDWDNLSASYDQGKVNILKVNCDEQKELAKKHGVRSFPTIKLLPGGLDDHSNAMEYSGARTANAMASYLDQHVSGIPSMMPDQSARVPGGPPVPRERAGQGPLTTSYVARMMDMA